MTAHTVGQNLTSRVITVPRGAVLTVTPTPGAYASVESTRASLTDVENNVAVWTPWPQGTIKSASTLLANETLFIRVKAIGGPAQYSIDENPSSRAMARFRPDWTAPIELGAPDFDIALARTNNAKRAKIIYDLLPKFAPFGRQLPEGGIYYDSNYAGSDSDGSIERPYKSVEGVTFNVPNQIVNFKRGSVFLVTATRLTTCSVTAQNVQFRAYGDPLLPPPLITGLIEVPSFALVGAEYEAALPQAFGPNCMAVTYGDQYGVPTQGAMVNGAVGQLGAGQAGYASGKLYLKDNPGTRKVYASVTGNALQVQADGFRMDGVHTGYTHNNTISLLSNAPGGIVNDVIMRDTGCWYSGNSAISGGDAGKTASNIVLIRHVDVGAYNNAISGQGDDSYWWVIEAKCDGKLRVASHTFAGYFNDAVTAHGTGIGRWIVAGCILTCAAENGIDIIGGAPGSGLEAVVHRGSIAMFNRIAFCNQIGLFMWAADCKVIGNIVTDTVWDPIRIGNQDSITAVMMLGGEAAYNFTDRGGLTLSAPTGPWLAATTGAGCSGIGFVWGGVNLHHNTMVISPNSVRAVHGSLAINGATPNPGGNRLENNLYILQRDGLGVMQFSASTSSLITARFAFRGNAYIVPSGNATLPFTTGGTPKTFAEWQSQVERTSRLFADTTAAGVSGVLYAPNIGSALSTSEALSSPGYDVNGRFANGCVGASAVAEGQ